MYLLYLALPQNFEPNVHFILSWISEIHTLYRILKFRKNLTSILKNKV